MDFNKYDYKNILIAIIFEIDISKIKNWNKFINKPIFYECNFLYKHIKKNKLNYFLLDKNLYLKKNLIMQIINEIEKSNLNYEINQIYFNTINHNISASKYDNNENIINCHSEYKNISEYFKKNKLKLNINNILLSLKIPEDYKMKSKINCIKIKNIKSLNLNMFNILNFFSLFGNIKFYCINIINSNIYLKFEDAIGWRKLYNIKNKLIYKNILIELEFLLFDYSILNINYIKEFYPINKFKRFNNKIKSKYNAPNNKILISNLDLNMKILKFYNWIKNFEDPLCFKIIRNNKSNSNFCILKFKSIQQCINVIMNINNKAINNKLIKINFTFNKNL